MRKLSTREAIENAIRVLLVSGKPTSSKNWQGIQLEDSCDRSNPMVEVKNMFFTMSMIESPERLAELTGADIPWAEDHFIERMCGASNPGEQYKNWPHWVVEPKFMEGEVFSHTYQERYWPAKNTGIRYENGSVQDIMDRIADDNTTRQAFLSVWHPEDQSNNGVRVPCTIGYWFNINNGQLDVTYLIRSCDARRHFRNDIYMTQRLANAFLLGINKKSSEEIFLGDMSIWIGSFHCFESDKYKLKKDVNG